MHMHTQQGGGSCFICFGGAAYGDVTPWWSIRYFGTLLGRHLVHNNSDYVALYAITVLHCTIMNYTGQEDINV